MSFTYLHNLLEKFWTDQYFNTEGVLSFLFSKIFQHGGSIEVSIFKMERIAYLTLEKMKLAYLTPKNENLSICSQPNFCLPI